MATMVVKRPVRRPSPELPSGELVLDAPPEIPAPTGRQWGQALFVLPMFLMMAAMMLMFSRSMTGGLRFAVFGIFGVALIAMIVVALIQGAGPSKKEMGYARRMYLRQLAQHRVRLMRSVRKQRAAMLYLHPDPGDLWSLVASYRLWERRVSDADFAVTRIGVGDQSPATSLIAPDTKPLEQLEPLAALALRRFLKSFNSVPGLPLAVALTGFAKLHLRGDRDRAVGMTRAMIAQLTSVHAPDDLRIAVCADPDTAQAEWEWVKWLPHALHPDKFDAAGPLRLLAPSVAGIEAMLEDLLANRSRFDPDARRGPGTQLVLILDGGSMAGSDHLMSGTGLEGVTIIDLTSVPPRALDRAALVLEVKEDGALSAVGFDGETALGTADALDLVSAEGLARQLAPLRLTGGARGEQPLSSTLGLAELLDLGDPFSFDPATTWVQRPNRDRLRVMFGIDSDGTPIELDLKESAQDGMGPHGLLIGATGSGKSELLRTLVLALAVTHPPNTLNFALIDFKGGATFTKMDKLPHTSAVITNLEEELHLVDRMTDALNGELIRRQEILRAAGNFSSLRDYERARAAGAPLPEVPVLVVIVDEFSELLSAKPDFIDTFVQIGRVGRSLGVHLLLASQRLEEGRLRGLDTHLSYRVGLRTFSAMDSRNVLGVADAFELPRAPGHGFLQFSTEPMARFRSAYVSGVHRRPDAIPMDSHDQHAVELLDYSTAYLPPAVKEATEPESDEDPDDGIGESLMDILVDRLSGKGTPAHQVWLPPLDEPPTLDGLLGPLAEDGARGLGSTRRELTGRLTATVGIADRPYEQRRDPLRLDLSGSGGHVMVIGGPRSGKSTTLRTLICSLALTHTPKETQFYCVDLGGGSLSTLRGLPHVGGVASRGNAGAVRRVVAQISTLLTERERHFAEQELDGIAAYRQARAQGRYADDPHGDVFLVIDGWSVLQKDFEDVADKVADIVTRGLAYGVHVVLTTARWYELRSNIRDFFVSKLELRLGDPMDSIADRMAALNVPEGTPGRGVTASKHQMIVAAPRIDGVESGDGLQDAVAELVQTSARAWRAAPAPWLRLLPGALPYDELPPKDEEPPSAMKLTIGIAEHDLAPVRLDFGADPHVLLLGDTKAGKTTFLRVLARRIVDSYRPQQARIVLVDHRRSLFGEISSEHLIGYGTDLQTTKQMMAELANGLSERRPSKDITPEQLRRRDWWQGPEMFVLVDDYDLAVPNSMDNPFLPLMEFVPQGRELGFHLVLTRRTGGASRTMFEQFLSRVRDVGSPGIMLSGDKGEGPLLGGLKPEHLPPGRGRLIRRGEPAELMQIGWLPPAED